MCLMATGCILRCRCYWLLLLVIPDLHHYQMQHPYSPNGIIYLFTHWNIYTYHWCTWNRANSTNNIRKGRKKTAKAQNTFFYSVSPKSTIGFPFISPQSWISQVNVYACMTRVLAADSVRATIYVYIYSKRLIVLESPMQRFKHTHTHKIYGVAISNCLCCSTGMTLARERKKEMKFLRYSTVMCAHIGNDTVVHT